MIRKLAIPVFASLVGFATLTAYAEEVKLSDHDRMELRQRADDLKSTNTLGSTRGYAGTREVNRSHDAKPMKVKHGKRHVKKHTRRAHSKRSA
jgi:hypothetical protein